MAGARKTGKSAGETATKLSLMATVSSPRLKKNEVKC